MIKLVVRRLLSLVPLLLAVAALTFFLGRLAPGDFFSDFGPDAQVSNETVAALRQQYGMDRSWYAQFGSWLWKALHGDLGTSAAYHIPVTSLLAERLFNTLLLAVTALILGLLVSFLLTSVALLMKSKWLDRALAMGTSIVISIPSFLWAFFALLFAAKTASFPIGSAQSLDYESLGAGAKLIDLAHHLALPAVVLALRQVPVYYRQLQGSLSEVLSEDYIIAARAKGLSERVVLLKHAMRNALNPVVSMFGQSLGSLLSGAFVVEAIMSWPGLGSLAVVSLLARDFDVVVGCLLYAAILLAAGNLIADVLLGVVDPRVRRPVNA